MDTIQKLIEGKNLTETEERVLRYFIEHIDDILDMGVRNVAKNTYTSTSTIMRLTKKLGYTGFVDMHYRLSRQIKSDKKIVTKNDEDMLTFFSTSDILEHNTYDDIMLIASKLMALGDKSVFIYANGFSSIAAEYFHKKLLVLGVRTIIANGNDSIGIFENNLRQIGLFMVISKSGETMSVYEKVVKAKGNDIDVLSFTNEADNKIAQQSDINLKLSDVSKLDDLNTYPNTFFPKVMMLMEMIVFEFHQLAIK